MVRISVSLRLSSSQRGRQAYCTTCGMSLWLPTASQVSNYPNHFRVLCTLVFPWMLKHIYKIKSTYNGFVVVVVVNCYFIFWSLISGWVWTLVQSGTWWGSKAWLPCVLVLASLPCGLVLASCLIWDRIFHSALHAPGALWISVESPAFACILL